MAVQQVKTMKKKVARWWWWWWWWLSWWWCCLCFCCWRSIGRCMDGEPQLRRRPRRRSDEEEEEAVSSRGDCGFESELEGAAASTAYSTWRRLLADDVRRRRCIRKAPLPTAISHFLSLSLLMIILIIARAVNCSLLSV